MMNKKIILISGGTRGLGIEITKLLINNNYKVIVTGRTSNEDIENLIKLNQENIFFESFDLKNIEKIKNFISNLSKKYGRIYGLINNAAVGYDGVLATMHESQISELLKINIEAPILLSKYVSRMMLLNNEGRIINISSIIATTGFNGLSVYGATKSALIGFTKSLSRELGRANITVNCISPGYMETEMTTGLNESKLASIKRRSPMKKLVELEDVAHAAIYLLSNEASSVTGITITVDAGSTA